MQETVAEVKATVLISTSPLAEPKATEPAQLGEAKVAPQKAAVHHPPTTAPAEPKAIEPAQMVQAKVAPRTSQGVKLSAKAKAFVP